MFQYGAHACVPPLRAGETVEFSTHAPIARRGSLISVPTWSTPTHLPTCVCSVFLTTGNNF